ncbi:hypothetical protein [Paenibacillus sp. UNC496MF]|uniref:hypothetical protein n=1 Tax=Paenibacillus sp. UNC496MF TaxID=1502753 RepID=UPI0011602864|nr:hypothetical protein [Paenibacillus sp. UNC496MF]
MHYKSIYEEVFLLNLLEQQFVFRVIGREEYKAILAENEQLSDVQEAMCKAAVVYPADYDFLDNVAGLAETISNFILDASGLQEGQAKGLLDQYRQDMQIFDYQADVIIHEAFPEFSIEHIQNWTVKKMMFYLARAEWVLVNLKGVPLMPIDQIAQAHAVAEMDEPGAPMPQEPPQFITPQQRAEMSPLANPQQPVPRQPAAQKQGDLSKEDVERMLSQAEGRNINLDQPTSMKEVFPELAWFKAEESLRGEYD